MAGDVIRKGFEGIYLEEYLNKLNKRLSDHFETVIINGYINYATRYRFSNSNLDIAKTVSKDSVRIFIAKNDKYLMHDISNVSTKEVDEIVSNIIKLYRVSPPTREIYESPNVTKTYYDIIPNTFSENIFNEDLSMDLIENILTFEGRNVKRLSGILSIEAMKHFIVTSYGVHGEGKNSHFLVRVRGFKDKELSYTDVKVGIDLRNSDVETLLNNIDYILGIVDYVSTVDEGKYNVVFSPQSYANLLNYLGYMLSGYLYIRNMSSLSGLLGDEIASKNVHIYDNPRMEGSLMATCFDEEGVETRKTDYFIDGIFNDLALNTLIGRKLDRESNGHAGIISPYPYPLIFEVDSPIGSEPDDIFKELGDGIYISNVWYTRFANMRLGTMSTLQRDIGLYIEGGKVKGGFMGARLSLTIRDLISKVLFATKPREWIKPWDVWMPSKVGFVAIEGVEVSTGF
ncbi:TPA: TldD/PmbA family protein [Candidatus Geothermarchaeota archaeon]|nr:TldD/PmbA family protein [Candidatus Geothermarchaeota archaeon]HIQ13254.1 TldD/PmbA family protein [Thermoprotei archaeon]